MKKDKKVYEKNNEEISNPENTQQDEKADENPTEGAGQASDELETIKTQFDEKTKQCEEYYNMLQRTVAEFDNYKKRTSREKETLYSEAVSDAVAAFLPVIDNLERAVQVSQKDEDAQSLKDGIELVLKQVKDVLGKLGVEEIKSIGESFDPQLHNAVMHIEDEAYGQNSIIEEFQKGYVLKEKVIRHSMVKVAN